MGRSEANGAAKLVLLLLSFTTVFHVLVLVGVVPYRIVWGGRVSDRERMRVLETVSISANLSVLWLVSMEAGYAKRRLSDGTLRAVFGGLTALFALNTVGNLLSRSTLERILFTPITFRLTYAFAKLARAG